MMNWQELNISTEIIESIKSKTDFTLPSRSLEIVKGILEYFAILKVELSEESLFNGDYLKLSPDEKDKLLVHFYWMHNRNKKTNESDFVSLNKIHEHLNIEINYVNLFFRQYSFTHSMQCPSCGSLVDVNFKNLRANQIIAKSGLILTSTVVAIAWLGGGCYLAELRLLVCAAVAANWQNSGCCVAMWSVIFPHFLPFFLPESIGRARVVQHRIKSENGFDSVIV